MSDFKQKIKSVEISALPEIALQLLQRLDGGGNESGAPTRDYSQPEAETVQRADFEFIDVEQTGYERGFPETTQSEKRAWQFPEGEARAFAERDFGGGEGNSESELRRFLDASQPRERANVEMAQAAEQGGYAMGGRAGTGLTADEYGQMERISEFFRRDGRRYDGGFRQY